MTAFCCRLQLCLGTRRFIWLVSIWFPYIAKVRLEKIFLDIFPGNRIKDGSRFSILIYLFLLAVWGTSKRIRVWRRAGSLCCVALGAPFILALLPPQHCRAVSFGFRAYVFLARCDSCLFLNPVTSPVLVSRMLRITPRLHRCRSQLRSTSSSFATAFSAVLNPCVGSSSAVTRASVVRMRLSVWMLVSVSLLVFW